MFLPPTEELKAKLKGLFKFPLNYRTTLKPLEEFDFQSWVRGNQIPYVDEPRADYDMRGFYQALRAKDPRATQSYDFIDNAFHYPDTWKTPFHETFSNESMYGKPTDPSWRGNKLYNALGIKIFEPKKKK